MVMKYEHLTRQMEIIPVDTLGIPITVIGVGAVGGWAALMLAKMGFCDLTCYDFDNVEIENINSQFYRFSDIGKSKCAALYEMIKDYSGIEIDYVAERWDSKFHNKTSRITVCGVDSMKSRREIFEACKENFRCEYFIDTRMAAEYISQFIVDMRNKEQVLSYEKTLFTDDEAVQVRCTAKSTVYSASLSASLIAKAVKDIATSNKHVRVVQWDVANNTPYMWKDGYTKHVTA